jgi:mitochondrial fission protein ELM1
LAEIGTQAEIAHPGDSAPRVWCLLGKKAGDNSQVRALARRLGWPLEEKSIVARPWELLVHTLPGGTLRGIDRGLSSELKAPWPDLVLSAGRRNEPVARWIQQQSGGRTRLAHIGRPWAALECWDLIITTPQYDLPQRDNILHNTLPLHDLDPDALATAKARFTARLDALPRPHIAVLIGGDSGKFVFTRDKGARLGELSASLARASAGSLLTTSGPRTPAAAADACEAALHAPHLSHHWGQSGENPYLAFLADADAFVVTGESMSMLAEAQSRGKPLFIFDLGDPPQRPWWSQGHAWRYKPLSHQLAMHLGPRRMRRDISRIQQTLIESGRALWLDESTACAPIAQSWLQRPAIGDEDSSDPVGEGELLAAVRALKALFD